MKSPFYTSEAVRVSTSNSLLDCAVEDEGFHDFLEKSKNKKSCGYSSMNVLLGLGALSLVLNILLIGSVLSLHYNKGKGTESGVPFAFA